MRTADKGALKCAAINSRTLVFAIFCFASSFTLTSKWSGDVCLIVSFLAPAVTLTFTYISDFVHKEHVRAANLAKRHTGRDDHLVALAR